MTTGPAVHVLVVMGVSGSGKSTIAAMLAGRLGWTFAEGDDLHPAANIEKMAHGIPLDDADREPWLAAIAARIDGWRKDGAHAVLTCSALKRRYRDQLAAHRPDVGFIYLKGDKGLIAGRLAGRLGHFMPPTLIDSQFDALEEPGPDEPVLIVPTGQPAAEITDTIIRALEERSGPLLKYR